MTTYKLNNDQYRATAEEFARIYADGINSITSALSNNQDKFLQWLTSSTVAFDNQSKTITIYPFQCIIDNTMLVIGGNLAQTYPLSFTTDSDTFNVFVTYKQTYNPDTQEPPSIVISQDSSLSNAVKLASVENGNIVYVVPSQSVVTRNRVSIRTKTTGWYRFAESFNECGNNGALYRVYYIRPGNHGTMLVWFGLHYGQTPTIHILSHSHYGSADYGVTQLRIVYKSTYDKSYLELYLNTDDNTTSTTIIEIERLDNASNGWFLLDQIQNGSVPDGYTTFVVDSRYKFNIDNNLRVTYNNNPVIKWYQDTDYAYLEMKSYGSNKSWLTLTFGDDPNQDRVVFHWKGTDGEYDVGYLHNKGLSILNAINTQKLYASYIQTTENAVCDLKITDSSWSVKADVSFIDNQVKFNISSPLVFAKNGANFLLMDSNVTQPTTDNYYDLGSSSYRFKTIYANVFEGTAVHAKYTGDIAEKFQTSKPLEQLLYKVVIPSDVSNEEIKVCDIDAPINVIGVVSNKPSLIMSSEIQGVPVALLGRVMCLTKENLKRGDLVVATYNGYVRKFNPETDSFISVIGIVINKGEGEFVEVLLK